ncbi:MAG: hypothetical protein KDA45_09995 [Planctomycetales bacterium]|nr:hypothetical protein [Planctomycetales bacterium]
MDHPIRATRPLSAVALIICLALASQGWGQEPAAPAAKALPLSSPSSFAYTTQPLGMSIVQQRAMFEADQRMLRLEWNKWIGYSPSRPNTNASYMSNGLQRYYIPARGVIVGAGPSRSWYW